MGVYAHRFIEIQDKDNKWQAQPLWSKYEESNYCQPDLVVGELKLKKNLCFLQRSSSGFYSPGALYSVDDISHPISQSELGDETNNYIEHFDYPVRIESFLLSELEAFADKCKEQVYAHIAEAFYDHNMQLIVKMLASTREVSLDSDDGKYCLPPRSVFDDYVEDYLEVLAELFKVYFAIHELGYCYNSEKVRVVFFYA